MLHWGPAHYVSWPCPPHMVEAYSVPVASPLYSTVARYSTVQCSTVQYCTSTVPYCTQRQRAAQEQVRPTVQYTTVQYSSVQYSTVPYRTVQYSTVQYPVQCSIVQYSTVVRSSVDLECSKPCQPVCMCHSRFDQCSIPSRASQLLIAILSSLLIILNQALPASMSVPQCL